MSLPATAPGRIATPPPTHARPSIATSSKWVLLGTLVAKPLQLATNLTLARMLGPAGFGTLNLANVTAVTLSGAVGLSLGDAANKFVAEHFRRERTTANEIASLIVWFLALFGALCLTLAWVSRSAWAPRVFHGASVDPLIGLCLLLAFGNLLVSLSVNLFTGLQLFRELTQLTVLQAALIFGLTVALGPWLGLYGALVASVVSAFVCIAWAATRFCSIDRNILRFPSRMALANIGRLLSFSLPSWLGGFLINPVTVFTFSYLALQPGGSEALGAFNTANGLKMLVAMLPGLIGSTIGPAIMEEAGRHGNPDAYQRLLDNALAALGFLTIPATILLILFSDVLFLIYGAAYGGSYALFMPLAAGVAVAVLSAPMQFAIVAGNRTWSLMFISAGKSGLLLLLALAWVPESLAAGLAWAWLLAEVGFAVLVTELAARQRLIPRPASYVFYRYAASMLLVLMMAVLMPAFWRWVVALPLAAGATIMIVRRHPAAGVWIAGAVPLPFRPTVRRTLALMAWRAVA